MQISLFSFNAEKPLRKYVKCFNGCSKVWQTVQISSHWMLNLELVKANGRIQDFKHPKMSASYTMHIYINVVRSFWLFQWSY